jgi:hypothetical protein
MQVQWEKRIPAVGEILSIDQDRGKSIVYQIVRVEWSITAIFLFGHLTSPRSYSMRENSARKQETISCQFSPLQAVKI